MALKVLTPLQFQDGSQQSQSALLDVQTISGNSEAYSGNLSVQVSLQTTASGPPLQLSYTPAVNAWWEVSLNVAIVSKIDAAYHYSQGMISINPVDVDGVGQAQQYTMQHASVNALDHRSITRIFKLAANTAYTVSALLSPSGGTWNYYMGKNHLWLNARAWAR